MSETTDNYWPNLGELTQLPYVSKLEEIAGALYESTEGKLSAEVVFYASEEVEESIYHCYILQVRNEGVCRHCAITGELKVKILPIPILSLGIDMGLPNDNNIVGFEYKQSHAFTGPTLQENSTLVIHSVEEMESWVKQVLSSDYVKRLLRNLATIY